MTGSRKDVYDQLAAVAATYRDVFRSENSRNLPLKFRKMTKTINRESERYFKVRTKRRRRSDVYRGLSHLGAIWRPRQLISYGNHNITTGRTAGNTFHLRYSPFPTSGVSTTGLRSRYLATWQTKALEFQIQLENQATFARYVPKWSGYNTVCQSRIGSETIVSIVGRCTVIFQPMPESYRNLAFSENIENQEHMTAQ